VPASSAPATSAPATPTVRSARHVVTIDLTTRVLVVTATDGTVLRRIPYTAGGPGHPTSAGTYTVLGKQPTRDLSSTVVDLTSTPTGSVTYDSTVHWYLDLGAGHPAIYAMPWQQGAITAGRLATHGDIGLSTADASWLYADLGVGDRVVVTGTG
jgi:lipoprotein-anchoring transpeptidase ErfK/SrfK